MVGFNENRELLLINSNGALNNVLLMVLQNYITENVTDT